MRHVWAVGRIRGYTLIDLIVTIFIVSVVSTLVMFNYRTGQNQAKLRQGVATITEAIREAQGYALGGAVVAALPPGGYGFHLSGVATPVVYQVFPDNNSNNVYDTVEDTPLLVPSGSLTPDIHITIETFYANGSSCGSSPELNVVFSPPLPSTSISNGSTSCGDSSTACITVSVADIQRQLKVNAISGLIDGNAVSCP